MSALFHPAWENSDADRRLEAVDALKDPAQLLKAITSTSHEDVRERALSQLTDRQLCDAIIGWVPPGLEAKELLAIKKRMIGRLDDDWRVAVAVSSLSEAIAAHALEGIVSESKLKGVVEGSGLYDIRVTAARRIGNPRVLRSLRAEPGSNLQRIICERLEAMRDRQAAELLSSVKKRQWKDFEKGIAKQRVGSIAEWDRRLELLLKVPGERVSPDMLEPLLTLQGDRGAEPYYRQRYKEFRPLVQHLAAEGWSVEEHRMSGACPDCAGKGAIWRGLGEAEEKFVDGPYPCTLCGGFGACATAVVKLAGSGVSLDLTFFGLE